MDSAEKPSIGHVLAATNKEKDLSSITDSYIKFYDVDHKPDKPDSYSRDEAAAVTSTYYDLATDFYEYGWGESFHFASINKGESREHAFARHEYKLALKLGLKKGDTVLDIGCGIGGPARHIAAFSEAKVIGININEYQLQRARKLTEKVGLQDLCEFIKGDFCNAPFPDESFNNVYSIEATCHASDDLTRVYGDVYRLLRPGGTFAYYEWMMTDKYDPTNDYHKKIKDEILIGDGLPDLVTKDKIHNCLEKVGFDILEAEDLALTSPVPWYSVLQAQMKLSDFKITPMGRWATHAMLSCMELLRLAPKGSSKVHSMLCRGADSLILGGKEGIFSPMYMVIARKPDKKS